MNDTIESLLAEGRTFPPSESLQEATRWSSTPRSTTRPNVDFEGFWARQAADLLDWYEDWDTILEWDLPFAKWFVGGKLNASYNCLDRHVESGHGDQVAYHWEGEPGDTRTITYAQLLDDVCRLANALKALGVAQGRPRQHLPRDGAGAADGAARVRPHRRARTPSCSAASPPTRCATGSRTPRPRCSSPATAPWRRGSVVPLKETADTAVAECPSIEKVLVLRRTDARRPHDRRPRRLVARPRAAAVAPSARPSAWTPRTSSTCSTRAAPPRSPRGSCTPPAAISRRWRGPTSTSSTCIPTPTSTGARPTSVGSPGTRTSSTARSRTGRRACIYEGTPDFPDKDRLWQIVEKYKVTILYTAPTAIRTFMKWGPEFPEAHDLSSLRLLGTRRRAHQPRSVGLVLAPHRWRTVPGRRHLVADRDRRHHDQPAPRRHHAQARERDVPAARHRRRHRRRRRRVRGDPRRRLPRAHPSVAVDAARASGATPSGTRRPTGRASATGTSPATAPSATTRATSGCSAASTT